MKLKERIDFVRKKRLCFGCLGFGQCSNRCFARKKCDVCQLKHPTLLHDPARCGSRKECSTQTSRDNPVTAPTDDTINNRSTESGDGSNKHEMSSMILPVWLSHQEYPDREVLVYALLDPASNGTFIKTGILGKLGKKGIDTNLRLNTMHGSEVIATQKISGLKVEDLKRTTHIELPSAVYCRDDIPARRSEIPRPEMAMKWEHLQELSTKLPQYQERIEIDRLIGSNCPMAIKPQDVIQGNEEDPYAIRTLLSWKRIIPVSTMEFHSLVEDELSCNRINTVEIV